MMLYERNNSTSTNHCHTFDTGKTFLNFDCHSLVLNDQESRLLLVNNHSLAFINVETVSSQFENAAGDDRNAFMTPISDVKFLPLFDECNINRPIVQWNHMEQNQYAVAIDRLVRIYAIDQSRINEYNTFIDSHHQRPISTISYSPHDPFWLLTGSLDGQVQVWDTRLYSSKSPASLRFTLSTPFSIRRIQWATNKPDNSNQLAVQCDRCIRIYDIRRADSCLLSSTDLEHTQRIISMDWTKQNRSVATLSLDHSIRLFSAQGQHIAESLPTEQSSYAFSKIHTTGYDNLFVCAARDTMSATYGFVGWRCDEDQYLRPLTDHILTTTPTSIVDFCLVTNARFLNLFTNSSTARFNDDTTNRFVLLTWCRDGHLSLVDMDSTFRQAWNNQQTRQKQTSLSDSSNSISLPRTSSNLSRQQPMTRSSSTVMTMDAIKDEATDNENSDEDNDNAFQGMSVSPPNTMESSDTSHNSDYQMIPDRSDNTVTVVSVANELNSLHDTYEPYISIEGKDEQRRICIIRCKYPLDNNFIFRIYLTFSRHYPTISQLFVRFKTSTIYHSEQFKIFQNRMQSMFDATSYNCFYHGQLCLHKCLIKLQNLFDIYYKEEKFISAAAMTINNANKKRDLSLTNSEIESLSGLSQVNTNNSGTNNNNNNHPSNRVFGVSSSSTRTSDSQMSNISIAPSSWRTCGARFSGGTYLICFGRISNNQQTNSATVLSTLNDGTMNRPQSLPMRSTSLTVGKSRENSTSIDQSSYRPPTTSTIQIQQMSNNQRVPMFSAPVRSTMGATSFTDHQRLASYRRSIGHLIHPPSTVSIYDVSILLPVSRKLADDYKIDFTNAIDMCENNEHITQEMGKDDLAHCWRLLGGLLSIQTNLDPNDSWFQTPIAQGLIKHLVSSYVVNGDIQSASMFLLTMSQTPYLKTKIQSKLVNEHNHDPILYAYACLLHRWKHFYRRTQILSQIDHNCQSPAPFNQTAAVAATLPPTTAPALATKPNIICSICLQPVLGQHFLCAVCGHGGHLTHMHGWFSSDELKHRFCPEKDCTCRCVMRQQELLTMTPTQTQQQQQQQTPTITSRPYFARQPSGGIRPL